MRYWSLLFSFLFLFAYSSWSAPQIDSLLFSLDTVSSPFQKKELLNSISSEYERLGDLENSLLFQHKYQELKDSLFQESVLSNIKETDSTIGIDDINQKLKENHTSLLETKVKNKGTSFIIQQYWYLFLVLLALLLFVLYKSIVKQKLNKKLSLEKEAVLKKYKTLEDAYTNVYNALEVLKKKSEEEQQQKNKELPDWFVKLSQRELEALSCLSIGMTDKEISQKMNISLATVRTYCRRIYSKLLVKNRSEAANIAKSYNLI